MSKDMRIYLSGPITGVRNYLDIFNKASAALTRNGYRVVNPANLCFVLDGTATREDFMNIDMELLRMCDVLVQLPGWETSLGCQREYGAALERDMIILKWEALVDGCTEKSRD